jgi:protein SCO1/2
MKKIMVIVIALWGALLLAPSFVLSASVKPTYVNITLHDLELLNQDGKRLKFKSNAIGDKIVAITFTYTNCTTICPVLDSIFTKLQDLVGPRLGNDVGLLPVSIDPVNDSPARLKKHALKLKAKPGWTFLTGRKNDVDNVLKGLDAYAPDIYNHPPTVFVGDGKKNVWKRLYGFPSAEKIMAVIKEFEDARK